MNRRKHVYTGAEWEDIVGYSRAVRVGKTIEVSGTTAIKDRHIVGQGDAYEQTRYILQVIRKAIEDLGGQIEHVVRTRMYVTDINQWEEVGRAHGEVFADIKPASTLLEVSALVSPEMLVEIEATAIVQD